MSRPQAARPLAGVHVLDLARVLAGPYAAMLLADLGADVVKVERPGTGDDTRQWGPPFARTSDGSESTYFLSVNRGKRSVTIDLKDPAERGFIEALLQWADVLVENFRPGVMERLGLGDDRLAELNPRLIRLAISGFGEAPPDTNPVGNHHTPHQQDRRHRGNRRPPGGRPPAETGRNRLGLKGVPVGGCVGHDRRGERTVADPEGLAHRRHCERDRLGSLPRLRWPRHPPGGGGRRGNRLGGRRGARLAGRRGARLAERRGDRLAGRRGDRLADRDRGGVAPGEQREPGPGAKVGSHVATLGRPGAPSSSDPAWVGIPSSPGPAVHRLAAGQASATTTARSPGPAWAPMTALISAT